MVNNPRKELWTPPSQPLPTAELARRKPGPIYDLPTVQELVKEGGDGIFPATDQCDDDLEKLEWDVDDVALLLTALAQDDYRYSEWCKGRSNIAIDADAYRIRYDHIEQRRGGLQHAEYYVKFGFRNNDPRLIIWLVSCHLSRERHGY